jgi:hypothetical protein
MNNPDDRVLRVEFIEEASIDAGGPYRETLNNMIEDLEKGTVPLLKKTANNQNNHGANRECFTVNEASTMPTH